MKAEQKLYETDPEFMERFEHFAYEEVVKEEGQTLDEKTRYLAILATLLGCQQGLVQQHAHHKVAHLLAPALPHDRHAADAPIAVVVDVEASGRRGLPLAVVEQAVDRARVVGVHFLRRAEALLLHKDAHAHVLYLAQVVVSAYELSRYHGFLSPKCIFVHYTRFSRKKKAKDPSQSPPRALYSSC